MSLLKEILRISDLMNINESLKTKNNIFDKFDIEEFKNFPPPSDNSSETKKEIEFLKLIISFNVFKFLRDVYLFQI